LNTRIITCSLSPAFNNLLTRRTLNVNHSPAGLIFTIAFAVAMERRLERLWRRSPAPPIMGAQARLMLTRAAANVFILAALGLSVVLKQYPWAVYIDPLGSLIIAASILMAAMGLLSSSFNDLLDRTLEEENCGNKCRNLLTGNHRLCQNGSVHTPPCPRSRNGCASFHPDQPRRSSTHNSCPC